MLIFSIVCGLGMGILIMMLRFYNVTHINLPQRMDSDISGKIINIKPVFENRLEITLNHVTIKKLPIEQTPYKIKLYVRSDSSNLMIGDVISTVARLSPIKNENILPYGYNFGQQNYFSGIGANGYNINPITVLSNREPIEFLLKIQLIRRSLYNQICTLVPPVIANFIAALMLGESKGIDRQVLQNMRYAGVSHVLCVSGLHLSLVAGICFLFSRYVLNIFNCIVYNFDVKRISAVISLVGSFIYWLLSGQQVAATRAFIMTSVYILGIIINRKADLLRTLAISSFIILSFSPEDVLNPSFQLSFIAVLALISGFKMYTPYYIFFDKYYFVKISNFILSNIYSSFLAGFATMPIAIKHFYICSNYTILANLIIVPIISFLVMPIILISMMLMFTPVASYLFFFLINCINIIIVVASYITKLPGSVGYIGYITNISLIVYLLSLFWLTLWQTKLKWIGLVGILIFCILMTTSNKPDLIISTKTNSFGVKNFQGKLEIYSNKLSSFNKQYWTNWFGQKEIIFHKVNVNKNNWLIITKSNHTISILTHNSLCSKSDITINLIDSKICKYNNITLTRDKIENLNSDIAIFCNDNCHTLPLIK